MNLYIVNVIIPNSTTLTTRVVADDARTARRQAVTNCPQAKGTLAYGEVVKCFPPFVGMSLPSTKAPTPRRQAPVARPATPRLSITVGNRRPGRNATPVAPVTAKRIPACPGRAFSPDDMSVTEAIVGIGVRVGTEWVDFLTRRAAQVAAEVAADVAAELHPTSDSNFLLGVGSAYEVESGGWDGWTVSAR